MKQYWSRLVGVAFVLATVACSESPAAPAAAPAPTVLEVPSANPAFTTVVGFIAGSPPYGGVVASEVGDIATSGGRTYSYSAIQNQLFDFFGWGSGSPPLGVSINGLGTMLPYQGIEGQTAVWSGTVVVPGPTSVDVKVFMYSPGITPTDTLASPSVPGGLFVVTNSTFSVNVFATGRVSGAPIGEDEAIPSLAQTIASIPGYTGPPPVVTFTPSFFWKLKTCDSGYFLGATGCEMAPAGSYSSGGSGAVANLCPHGTYQPDAGQWFCINAPKGSYAEGPGATEATLCAAGTYSDTPGSSSCTAAPRGTFVADAGAATPVACAVGTFAPNTGSTECILAPIGSYVPTTRATSPTLAPAGSYVNTRGASSATQCSAGTYQNQTGQSGCFNVPAGSYSGAGAASATLCPSGYYTAVAGQSSCIAAPAGSYAAGPGGTSSTLCAAGSFTSTDGQGSCSLAPAGKYVSDTGATSATLCAAGYYQPSLGQTSCIAASIGFFVATPGAASQTQCQLGWTTNAVGSTSCVRIDPLVAFDALISAAQTTPGVAASEVNKLVTSRKQLVAAKPSSACKAIDGFMSYVIKDGGKKISVTNGNMLLLKSETAKGAIGC